MEFEESIYEAGKFKMAQYSKDFIDDFLTKPDKSFPLKNGMTDKDYSGVRDDMAHYRPPLLVVYEIEPDIWSLNLAEDPDTVVCQIDHKDKLLRIPEPVSDEAKTAVYYAMNAFNSSYIQNYSKKRSVVLKGTDTDYKKTGEIIEKDFTHSKYITRFDISNLFKI